MRLDVVANIRLPSERAGTLQTVKMCDAFAACGAEVRLVYPFRFQSPAMRRVRDWRTFYGVGRGFRTRCLPTLDLQIPSDPFVPPVVRKLLFHMQNASFAASAFAQQASSDAEVTWTREPVLARTLPRPRGRRLFVEVHQVPTRGRARFVRSLRRADGIVTITDGLRIDLGAMGLDPARIVVEPDGVDLEAFDAAAGENNGGRQECLPHHAGERPARGGEEAVVGYAGQLLKWKGVHALALASRFLPAGARVCMLGGWDWQVADFRAFCRKEGLDRVVVAGMVPPWGVPAWLKRFDVLVLPNTATEEISARHTSPLKLFEYMAAGRPIVASDLPSIREVLRDGDNAVLVAPDDPRALAAGIRRVLDDPSLAERVAARAREEVQRYAWRARAKRLLALFEGRTA